MGKGKEAKIVSNKKLYIFIIWDDVATGWIMINYEKGGVFNQLKE